MISKEWKRLEDVDIMWRSMMVPWGAASYSKSGK